MSRSSCRHCSRLSRRSASMSAGQRRVRPTRRRSALNAVGRVVRGLMNVYTRRETIIKYLLSFTSLLSYTYSLIGLHSLFHGLFLFPFLLSTLATSIQSFVRSNSHSFSQSLAMTRLLNQSHHRYNSSPSIL